MGAKTTRSCEGHLYELGDETINNYWPYVLGKAPRDSLKEIRDLMLEFNTTSKVPWQLEISFCMHCFEEAPGDKKMDFSLNIKAEEELDKAWDAKDRARVLRLENPIYLNEMQVSMSRLADFLFQKGIKEAAINVKRDQSARS